MKKSIGEQIAALKPEQQTLVPEIRVELEPHFEMTAPAPDMSVIANVVRELMSREQAINVTVMEPEKKPHPPKTIQVDVTERDGRGLIKTFICTELTDGR